MESRWLTKNFSIHAMMDLSDGLGADLPRLARASRVGFDIDLEIVRGVGQCAEGRIKIPDGPFVDVLPVEENEIPCAVYKDRHCLKKIFIKVVVYCSASRESDFSFP